MRISYLVAPEKYCHNYNDVLLFLAGGIINCKNWQNMIVNAFEDNIKDCIYDFNLVLASPRRENFSRDEPFTSQEQIEWEFKHLQKIDFFFMYFDGPTISDQPICFYELGRNLLKMQQRFGKNWEKHCCICVNKEFKRIDDVLIQTNLASEGKCFVNVIDNQTIKEQFDNIAKNIIKQIEEFFI